LEFFEIKAKRISQTLSVTNIIDIITSVLFKNFFQSSGVQLLVQSFVPAIDSVLRRPRALYRAFFLLIHQGNSDRDEDRFLSAEKYLEN